MYVSIALADFRLDWQISRWPRDDRARTTCRLCEDHVTVVWGFVQSRNCHCLSFNLTHTKFVVNFGNLECVSDKWFNVNCLSGILKYGHGVAQSYLADSFRCLFLPSVLGLLFCRRDQTNVPNAKSAASVLRREWHASPRQTAQASTTRSTRGPKSQQTTEHGWFWKLAEEWWTKQEQFRKFYGSNICACTCTTVTN